MQRLAKFNFSKTTSLFCSSSRASLLSARYSSDSPRAINLTSPCFSRMREQKSAFVDKTAHMARFLNSELSNRVFFTRPRRFGTTLALDLMNEILSAGKVPSGCGWPGRREEDVDFLFGGLEIHKMLNERDTSLGDLLTTARFVISLALGTATSGSHLRKAIIGQLENIARSEFGEHLASKVGQCCCPSSALETLITSVPRGVDVVVLVDEYDMAITDDVAKKRWGAAQEGIEALRSLLMVTKDPQFGERIEKFVVTGVCRYAVASRFSRVNNFVDATNRPELTGMMGFSEQEIRDTFPELLSRLKINMQDPAPCGTDAAIQELARWFDGYCFDGQTMCYNPLGVLESLQRGHITNTSLEAASSSEWIGVPARVVVKRLAEENGYSATIDLHSERSLDLVSLNTDQTPDVNCVSLLFQAGLLSLAPRNEAPPSALVTTTVPNDYARRSLMKLVAASSGMSTSRMDKFANEADVIRRGLTNRDPALVTEGFERVLEQISHHLVKKPEEGKRKVGKKKLASTFHTVLDAVLRISKPESARITPEASVPSGILVDFSNENEHWIIEIGTTRGGEKKKLETQAQRYANSFIGSKVLCCSVVARVAPCESETTIQDGPQSAYHVSWTVREKGEQEFRPLDLGPVL